METYQEYITKAAVLIEAMPYIQRFREALVVVKFGGSAMENTACTESTLRDIAFMSSVGMRPVVVHGGGKEISARLKTLGIPTKFINGLRYTCAATVKVVDEVLHQDVNKRLVDGIAKFGGHAVGLSGKQIVTARKMMETDRATGEPIDLGFVGEASQVDPEPILELVRRQQVPVITPLGLGEDGQVYNINADICACEIARALRARKLVFLSDVPGLLRDPKDESTLISTVRIPEVESLVQQGVISGGMAPKIASAVAALAAGTNKVHLIDARLQHSLLLEIFTDRGVGTQIVHG
jgi:acetylglutamate kinase